MEDDQDESTSASCIPRHRSPAFEHEEIKILLDLINEFKEFILNKATTSAASHAKELAWVKLTNKFNNHGFKITRSIESLKYKWRNLMNNVRKQSKNLLFVNQDEAEFASQVMSLIHDEDIHNNEVVLPPDFEDDLKDIGQKSHNTNGKKENWENNAVREQMDSCGNEHKAIRNRSINFSPRECRLLLKCVQAERKYIFCKEYSTRVRLLKNAAWIRVTEEYNRQSPQKRSKKVLQTKFLNIKRGTNKLGHKKLNRNKETNYVKLFDDNCSNVSEQDLQEIKTEPLFEAEDEPFNDNDDKSVSDDNFESEVNSGDKLENPDPLSTVLGSDSGLGSSVNIDTFNPFENNEVVKLKVELLKHKIENAKLKNKRIENAIQEDAKAQKLNAVERALRLRTARLEAAAAALKLPHAHPALLYTEDEVAAQSYLKQSLT